MRRPPSLRWLGGLCLLALVLVNGCGLPATVTPVPTTLTPSLPTTPPSDATVPPELEQPTPVSRPDTTATPAPTALSEPGIVATWMLSTLPAQGRSPNAIVVLGDYVMVANSETSNVSVIADGVIVDVLPVAGTPGAMVADVARQRAYLACYDYETSIASIQVLAPQGAITSWVAEEPLGALAVVGDTLWAADDWGDQIHIIDLETGSERERLALNEGDSVQEMLAHPSQDRVFVRTSQALRVVEVESGALLNSLPLDNVHCMALSPDGASLYYSAYGSQGDDYVQLLATSDLMSRQRLEVPSGTNQIAVAADGGQVALTIGSENSVWLLEPDLTPRHEVLIGYGPKHAVFGADGLLYVANQQADSLTIVDAQQGQAISNVALGALIADLAVDPVNGRVYAVSANEDQVLVWEPDGAARSAWTTGRYPVSLATWPGEGKLAVLSMLDRELAIHDQSGTVQQRFATEDNPSGVMIDIFQQRIYAGGLVVDMQSNDTRMLTAKVYTDLVVTPVKTLLDTRRERLYGIVPNGIPGSNGGLVIQLLDSPEGSVGPDSVAWRSVLDAVYDEEQDVFYVAWTHMGSHGLVVVEAETGRLIHDLHFAEPVTAMALNQSSRHLWLATGAYPGTYETDAPSLLHAYDTRSMAMVQEIPLDAAINDMAIDPRLMRLYLASNQTGSLYVLQDMVMRSQNVVPGPPTVTPQPTYAPEVTVPPPTPGTAPTPCAVLPHPVLALVAPVAELGCALADGGTINLATQPFEGGLMLWREDTGKILALIDGGALWTLEDAWSEGMPDSACEVAAPSADRWQPIRGFGLVWCQQPELRQRLGWALEPEQGLTAVAQAFERGELVHLASGETLFLGSMGAWKRLDP